MPALIAMTAATLAAASPDAPAPAADERIFTTSSYVSDGGEDAEGLWFRLYEPEIRYRLPHATPAEADTYWAVLRAAVETGVALRVRYDGAAGHVHADEGMIDYPLCSLSVSSGAIYGSEETNCPPSAPTDEAALPLAIAYVATAPGTARQMLADILAADDLAPRLRPIALKARGEAAEAMANDLEWRSADSDAALVSALADYRLWVGLMPDEPEAYNAVARVLIDLGAYDEALAVYRSIGRRMPLEAFNVAIRIGAIHRLRGEHREALRQLDDYTAREGPQEGMRFNYHRGWTLNLLGRFEEAADSFRRGLLTQPDYPFAFFLRACAYGQLGRIAEALADQRRGLELLRGGVDYGRSWQATELAHQSAIEEELARLAAARRRVRTAAACAPGDPRGSSPRDRSALLDAGIAG